MSLHTEITEFVDALTDNGQPWHARVHTLIREGVDVVAPFLDAGENADEISNELIRGAKLVAAKLGRSGFLANAFIQSAIPPMVAQAAAYSGTLREFVDAEVLPRLDLWITTLTKVRDELRHA